MTLPAQTSSIRLYGKGLVYVSACAPKDTPVGEIELYADQEFPTGLDHGWRKSPNETFSTGQPNPCECNDDPDRLHWLLDC